MDNPEDLTEETIAYDLREAFVRRKRNNGGSPRNYNLSNSQYVEAFESAARVCKELRACPILFIDAQFAGRHPDNVFPTMFGGTKGAEDNARKQYNRFIEEDYVKAELLFPVLLDQLKRQIELGRTVEETLVSEHLSFPAWFRVCITKDKIPEVMQKFCKAAQAELNEDIKGFLKSKGLSYKRIYEL